MAARRGLSLSLKKGSSRNRVGLLAGLEASHVPAKRSFISDVSMRKARNRSHLAPVRNADFADERRSRAPFLGTAPGDGLVEGRLTKSIIGCFYEVYNTMGFGFLERVYAAALTDELEMRGHHVDREVVTHVAYKGRIVAHFKLDRVVDDRVVDHNRPFTD